MPQMNRRSFLSTAAAGFTVASATAETMHGAVYSVSEWTFNSGKHYDDPFNQIDLDLLITGPDGAQVRVPAFWSGALEWRARFAPPKAGRYTWRTICSDNANRELHGRTGLFDVEPASGTSAFLQHGPIRVARDSRHFE